MENEKLLTVSDVSEMLGVSDRTVRNWVQGGNLTAYRFGREYKITQTDLNEFIKQSQVVAGENPNNNLNENQED